MQHAKYNKTSGNDFGSCSDHTYLSIWALDNHIEDNTHLYIYISAKWTDYI